MRRTRFAVAPLSWLACRCLSRLGLNDTCAGFHGIFDPGHGWRLRRGRGRGLARRGFHRALHRRQRRCGDRGFLANRIGRAGNATAALIARRAAAEDDFARGTVAPVERARVRRHRNGRRARQQRGGSEEPPDRPCAQPRWRQPVHGLPSGRPALAAASSRSNSDITPPFLYFSPRVALPARGLAAVCYRPAPRAKHCGADSCVSARFHCPPAARRTRKCLIRLARFSGNSGI